GDRRERRSPARRTPWSRSRPRTRERSPGHRDRGPPATAARTAAGCRPPESWPRKSNSTARQESGNCRPKPPRSPRGLDDRRSHAYVANVLGHLNEASALISVVIIDVVLAGDNAIVVGMAAAGLAPAHRRRVIALGIAAATVLRILFAFCALE